MDDLLDDPELERLHAERLAAMQAGFSRVCGGALPPPAGGRAAVHAAAGRVLLWRHLPLPHSL